MNDRSKFLLLLGLAFIGASFSFKLSEAPFLWTFLIGFLVSSAGAVVFCKTNPRLGCIYLGVTLFTLAAFEYYWGENVNRGVLEKVETTPGYYQESDMLGYGPVPGYKGRARKTYGKEVIYDVKYTINQEGLRKSSAGRDEMKIKDPCILFFGGSVTFGEGVNDEESMPFQVSKETGSRYHILNFGFHGYGPHQMLSAIEHGFVKKKAKCQPRFVFYQAIVAHIARSAGLAHWDTHGPKYRLNQSGEVVFEGNFDDGLFSEWLKKYFKKSQIYKKIFGLQRAINENDIELYLAVVKTARDKLIRDFPGVRFQVLFWDSKAWSQEQEHLITRLKEGFEQNGIQSHLISQILPGFLKDQSVYELSTHDHHPNETTHKLIAKYISRNILENHKKIYGK